MYYIREPLRTPDLPLGKNLGTGEQNIKLHRAQIMGKMGVEPLADLVRLAERFGIGK